MVVSIKVCGLFILIILFGLVGWAFSEQYLIQKKSEVVPEGGVELEFLPVHALHVRVVSKGATNKNDLAYFYLQALQQKDRRLLASLNLPGNTAEEEITGKINQFGGRTIQNPTYSFKPGYVNDRHGDLLLRGRYEDNNQVFTDQLFTIIGEDGNWYISLGCFEVSDGGTGDCQHPRY